MKLAIAALLTGAAAAFTPSSQNGASNTALAATKAAAKAAPKSQFAANLAGALPPVGFFDPLNFAGKADDATLARYRQVEVMHGRFAQMAFLGFVVPEKVAQGAVGGDYLAPGGTALDALSSTPNLVILTLALLSGLELLRLVETTPEDRINAKVEGLGWRPSDPERYNEMVVRELQNGRLAMLAVAGIVAQELVNGKPVLINLQDSNFVSW